MFLAALARPDGVSDIPSIIPNESFIFAFKAHAIYKALLNDPALAGYPPSLDVPNPDRSKLASTSSSASSGAVTWSARPSNMISSLMVNSTTNLGKL